MYWSSKLILKWFSGQIVSITFLYRRRVFLYYIAFVKIFCPHYWHRDICDYKTVQKHEYEFWIDWKLHVQNGLKTFILKLIKLYLCLKLYIAWNGRKTA